MIKIEITGRILETVNRVVSLLAMLLEAEAAAKGSGAVSDPAAEAPAATTTTSKKTRGRPKKEPAPAEEAPASSVTKDQLKEVIGELNDEIGFTKTKKLIQTTGADRLGEVEESKYEELYKKAKAALKASKEEA